MTIIYLHNYNILCALRLVEGGGSLVGVQLVGLLDSVGQGELEVLGQELSDVLSLDVGVLGQELDLQDVDRSKSSSVTSSQVLVHGGDGTDSGHISVFLVHVVDTRSGLVSDPDTKGLDSGGVSLGDNVNRNDLTGRGLDLVQFL